MATAQAYEKIQALVESKPELDSAAAAKLAALVEELENLDVSKPSEDVSPLEKLKIGFASFKKGFVEKNPLLCNKLKGGQWPKFMVVACADSRVCPTSILGFQPGDAFMMRNVANMIPPFEKEGYPSMGSAVEYAVLHLKVEHIIVIGHRACGGIGALVKMTPEDGSYSTTFIEKWVEIGKPARTTVNGKLAGEPVDTICKTCEKESVNNSLANLLTYPFLVDAVAAKKISLHGGYYDHVEGIFQKWDYDINGVTSEPEHMA